MSVLEDADMEEVYATERQLLYVAATRARDQLERSYLRILTITRPMLEIV